MAIETTVFLVKPDGVRKGLTGVIREIILAFDLSIEDEYEKILLPVEIREMYTGIGNITKRDYFPDLVEYMSSSPSHVFILRGENAIEKVRIIIGKRDPPFGIRSWWAESIIENVAHGPHDEKEAESHLSTFLR